MTDIDWKAELRKYEREFEGLPPEPSPADVRQRHLALVREDRRNEAINDSAGAWLRVLLVAALAGALQFWPYDRSCGIGLFGFLGAQAMVVLGALWATVHSWRRRVASVHVIAFALLLAGAAMAALEILPRVGYAWPDPARPAGWFCEVS